MKIIPIPSSGVILTNQNRRFLLTKKHTPPNNSMISIDILKIWFDLIWVFPSFIVGALNQPQLSLSLSLSYLDLLEY